MPVKPALVALGVLNAIVLLGQLWPAGAPPFARVVNIACLVANLVAIVVALRERRQPRGAA